MALVSSIDLKKADGSPLKVNFQFQNGLPVKPIINPPVDIWYSKRLNKYGITFTIENVENQINLKLSQVSYHNTSANSKDIWIHLESCYFVVYNVKNDIIKKMKDNGLLVSFIDINGNNL